MVTVRLPPGRTIWLCRFTHDGTTVERSTGQRDYAAAQQRAKEIYAEVIGGRGSMPKEVGHKAGSDMGAVPGAANAGGRGSNRLNDTNYYGEARGKGEIDQSPAGGKDYDDERKRVDRLVDTVSKLATKGYSQ